MHLSFLAQTALAVTIAVSPESPKTSDELHVTVTGLEAGQETTLSLVSATDAETGGSWSASAVFTADAEGKVDLKRDAPTSGAYRDVNAMGLLQFLRWTPRTEAPDWGLLGSLELKAEVFGRVVTTQRIARQPCYLDQDVEWVDIEENGLRGTYVRPKNREPAQTLLVLGGSGGGLPFSSACNFARQGYAALALAYFAYQDLPTHLVQIPLEYFEKGLDWLKARPDTLSHWPVIWGASRGGELALLLGATFPSKVAGVIGMVPSSYVWGGLPPDGTSVAAWTYRGQDVPRIRRRATLCLDQIDGKWANRRCFFENIALAPADELALATIPVENIAGPVLLISGTDDQMWPAAIFGDLVRRRLAERDFPHQVTHLKYPAAGHAIFAPYWPVTESFASELYINGGTPEGYAKAEPASHAAQLQFLSEIRDNTLSSP